MSILTKLHVGCGTRKLPGYHNIDHREEVEPDDVMDALDLKVPYNSLDEIYACHILEHFRNPAQALSHWRTRLKTHGILRLAVPDIRMISYAYHYGGVHLCRLSGLIWGGHKYEGDEHYHGWDFEELAQLLRCNGFFDIRRWYPQDVFPEGYHDISYAMVANFEQQEWSVSLNIQAKKI